MLLLASCTSVGVPVSHVSVPSTLSFDAIPITTRVTRTLTLTNSGTAAANIQVTVGAPLSASSEPLTVPALGSLDVPVSAIVDGYEAVSANLVVTSPERTFDVAVTLTVDPDLDDDGALALGAGGDDCDDERADVHPGADETCDGSDEDCDDRIDEAAVDTFAAWTDGDDDGYGTGTSFQVCALGSLQAAVDGDCNDGDASVHPNAVEEFYDGIDADCAEDSDYDADQDGYDSDAYGGTDCDDAVAAIHPDAVDTPYDGIDTDCGGGSDYDADGDGQDSIAWGGLDCDDGDENRFVGQTEVDDGVDQDCDVLVDEDSLVRGDWSFRELMLTPSTQSGAFLELANTSGRTLDLAGLRLEGPTDTSLPAMSVLADEVVLLCTSADPATNGGITNCDAVITLDSQPALWAKNRALDEVDATAWTLTSGVSVHTTASPDANDAESAWCASTTAYGDGDLGTPGVDEACP
ncbi:MAG: hypothetical protein EP330_17265 [Deltaproteobacteria bacterium]|nr:MAG: hypothetical protein EP330_17265 [Deltaproteobacteria bacterium]